MDYPMALTLSMPPPSFHSISDLNRQNEAKNGMISFNNVDHRRSKSIMVATQKQKLQGESQCSHGVRPKEEPALGITIDCNTYASLLQACSAMEALAEGKGVHAHMLQTGIKQNPFLGANLVSMYVKCGSLHDARLVFDQMPKRNLVTWTAMIGGCARYGCYDEALSLYCCMQLEGMQPDKFIFPCVLRACAGLGAIQLGLQIHGCIIRSGLVPDPFVGSALVDMYAKCNRIEDALQVFDKMPKRDVVSWNAMIAAYARHGQGDQALKLLRRMQTSGMKPDGITWNAIIAGYSQNGQVEEALKVFYQMQQEGVEQDAVVWNAMIAGYANDGNQIGALELFRRMQLAGVSADVITWNSMISGYVRNGFYDEALKLFCQMQLTVVKPNSITIMSSLQACAQLAELRRGKEVHNYIIRSELQSDILMWNALIDMYGKCGRLQNARHVFDRMSQKDVVSWNTMIASYAQNGYCNVASKLFTDMTLAGIKPNVITWNTMIAGHAQNGNWGEALTLIHQMQLSGAKPNPVTVTSILPACTHVGALQQGKEIHGCVIRTTFEFDVFVGNALIDMYAKCGNIEDACQVFNKMSQRDVSSYTTMIIGYAMHGQGESALTLFDKMQKEGMKPNHITFTGLLSACSHAGLLGEGWKIFNCMSSVYQIKPNVHHYACMVDLIGRTGRLKEAWDFINQMPLEPNATVWGCLLGACKMHCNVELGERVAEHLFELDPQNAGSYVLLSNIFAVAGRWNDVAKVRKRMKDMGLKKTPGCSWIEVGNKFYAFIAGDTLHPQIEKIFSTLDNLAVQMEKLGMCLIQTLSCMMHNRKRRIKFCGHNEKLPLLLVLSTNALF